MWWVVLLARLVVVTHSTGLLMVRYHLGLAAEGQAREAATCRDMGGFGFRAVVGFRVSGFGFGV